MAACKKSLVVLKSLGQSALPNRSAWRLNETAMSESHLAYLNLGSNIQPETNLPKAVKLLYEYGEILQVSKVWESAPIGTEGSNYLNACLLFKSTFNQIQLKTKVVHPIENQLRRKRSDY